MPLQRRTSEEPRESIDTALELLRNAVASEVLSINDNPASLKGEEIGSSDNDPGDATANSNDLH
jgi:hypothetical protein